MVYYPEIMDPKTLEKVVLLFTLIDYVMKKEITKKNEEEIEVVDFTLDDGIDIREPRVYEVGYLLTPQINDDKLDAQIDVVRKIITDNGGLPISEGRAELIDLEYTMEVVIDNQKQSFSKGFFGWIKFDVTPEKMADIKEALDSLKTIVRFLLIKTVRENTTAVARTPRPASSDDAGEKVAETAPVAEKTEETPVEKIDEEALDKQIDDLVVEEETSETSE